MKKRLCSAVLALALCLVFPCPALGTEAPKSYEQAVAELRGRGNYAIEEFLDCALCSVFLGRWVGTPHSAYHELTLVYKAGSPLGDGTTVELPLQTDNASWGTTHAPDTLGLNEDGSGLRYTYYSPEHGTDVSSVDLATGEVTTAHVPPTYEEIFEAYTLGWTVERQLEAPGCTAVLMWSDLAGAPETEQVRDYALALISREDMEPERQFRRLVLPSTKVVEGEYPQYPTARAPDELFLNGDGSALTYVYRFPEALYNAGGELLHDAGTYTYRVDTATGELKAEFEKSAGAEGTTFVDVAPGDWFAPYVDVCVEAGLMNGVGEGAFSPEGTLTQKECTVLALRLHDLGRGGDGSFDKAPDSWGYATLTLSDGTVREGYFGSGGSAWDWRQLNRGDLGHFGFPLESEEEKEWGRSMDCQSAVFSVNGRDFPGKMHLSGPGFLYFSSSEYDDIQAARFAPLPGAWWRDAWYYAEQNGLAGLTYDGGDRRGFAAQMAAVTDLPAINQIAGLPDTGDSAVLEFYRAGVLTGGDEYGTFRPYSTMTRAEAAAICARILRPELRVSFSPKPLETYADYTLTYLRPDGERPGGPYRALHSTDLVVPDRHSLMNLDGVELPVPEGYEVVSIGDGLAGLASYGPPGGSEPTRYGLMDAEGRFQECGHQEVNENPRLGWFPYTTGELFNGYVSQGAFYDAQGRQVTPCFDWAGTIGPSGAGFVGMDGDIYRIQLPPAAAG